MPSLAQIASAGSAALPTGKSLAQIAAAEFERRRRTARNKVARDELDARQANEALRPWLALACRAGADFPEFEDALAELRVIPAQEGKLFFDDAQLRAVVADDICPLPAIRAALAAARDQAIERATETEGLDPERNDRAGGLAALAIAFGAPAYRPKPALARASQLPPPATAHDGPQARKGDCPPAVAGRKPSEPDGSRPAPEGAKQRESI